MLGGRSVNREASRECIVETNCPASFPPPVFLFYVLVYSEIFAAEKSHKFCCLASIRIIDHVSDIRYFISICKL